MPSLPVLLRKYKELHRRYIDLEGEIADVERQMVEASNAPRPRAARSTKAEMIAVVRDTVKVLRDANEALPRREIASRLGISPHAAACRLKKAVEAKFVEKLAHGRYRCTNVVPAF